MQQHPKNATKASPKHHHIPTTAQAPPKIIPAAATISIVGVADSTIIHCYLRIIHSRAPPAHPTATASHTADNTRQQYLPDNSDYPSQTGSSDKGENHNYPPTHPVEPHSVPAPPVYPAHQRCAPCRYAALSNSSPPDVTFLCTGSHERPQATACFTVRRRRTSSLGLCPSLPAGQSPASPLPQGASPRCLGAALYRIPRGCFTVPCQGHFTAQLAVLHRIAQLCFTRHIVTNIIPYISHFVNIFPIHYHPKAIESTQFSSHSKPPNIPSL